MVKNNLIAIEVAFAKENRQEIMTLQVEKNCTIETAIDRSGILERFPEINLMEQKVGIFSQLKKLTTIVKAGDRIEIYRQLQLDPKEARRQRAKK